MFAVIKSGGKQYRVREGDVIDVEKLAAGAGEKFHFSQILLIAYDKNVLIGMPFLEKALVRAEVIRDFKDEKVVVFKKKRRKQFKRTRGHRQRLTRVRIEKIIPDVTGLPAEELKAAEMRPAEVAGLEKKRAIRPKKTEAPTVAAKPEKEKKAAKAEKATPARAAEKKKAK